MDLYMKLLYCRYCQDIFDVKILNSVNFKSEHAYCRCGRTYGVYINNMDIVYSGEYAVCLRIDNKSLHDAVKNIPLDGKRSSFRCRRNTILL